MRIPNSGSIRSLSPKSKGCAASSKKWKRAQHGMSTGEIPPQTVRGISHNKGDSEVNQMPTEQAIQEIRQAVRQITRRPPTIRVLPTMPAFTYRFNCYRCGGKVCSAVYVSGGMGGEPIKVCSVCGGTGTTFPEWEKEMERRREWKRLRDASRNHYVND